jgi:diadenosine tetraphosphate (Ap4A) HIT family hydrolase
MYDSDNVFAKILRKELPSTVVFENEYVLAFKNINPTSKTHILVIPKKPYTDYGHFVSLASGEEVAMFFKSVNEVAVQLGISGNYRLTTNNGTKAGQEVFHFHVHLQSSDV